MEHRIGMETEVVVVRQLIALRIVKRQSRLKPAGNGVGQIGDQFPRTGGDDQVLALVRLEPIPVRIAGRELLPRAWRNLPAWPDRA